MRMTARQLERVRAATARHFGPDARLWLFGSRVDDSRRGGDYDLYLEVGPLDARTLVDAKLAMLAELHATPEFEDERIDLVVRRLDSGPEQPIHRCARTQGVPL
jgi:predicted nucleotidyltransferase